MKKQNFTIKLSGLTVNFKNAFQNFLLHEGRITHQQESIRELKCSLKSNEILIHMDFSENYVTKYSQEVQSFHFGGSRNQITLHTVVTYTKIGNELKISSYCTLSSSLKHNVPAIWAHLLPILYYIPTGIDTIHFLSDGPSTQYRNRTMFYFLTKHLKTLFPQLKYFTWNYSEAGHGKGAPDGIGGVCKRTADREVANGKDITNVYTLYEILVKNCPGVRFCVIEENEITKFTDMINDADIVSFKGTMKIHQVVSGQNQDLFMRTLSCFSCKYSCHHYGIGSVKYAQKHADSTDSDSSDDEIMQSFQGQRASSQRTFFKQLYSSNSSSA